MPERVLFRHSPGSRAYIVPFDVHPNPNHAYHFLFEWSLELVPGGNSEGHHKRYLCGPVEWYCSTEPLLAWSVDVGVKETP